MRASRQPTPHARSGDSTDGNNGMEKVMTGSRRGGLGAGMARVGWLGEGMQRGAVVGGSTCDAGPHCGASSPATMQNRNHRTRRSGRAREVAGTCANERAYCKLADDMRTAAGHGGIEARDALDSSALTRKLHGREELEAV